ncbi:MAG: helix-hairpin-helix domain-containing protein [Candidatus Microgenomates bacterium]
MKKIIKKYLVEIFLLIIAFVFTTTSLIIYLKNNSQIEENNIIKTDTQTKNVLKIYIDVSGSVNNPDLYEAPNGTRLKDIIKKAGGLSETADKNYFYRNFNLARILNDQEKIYIPSIWEVQSGLFTENQTQFDLLSPNYSQTNNITYESSLININQATIDELDTLPGIGKATAQKIIDNRPYQNLDDLINKKITNKTTYEKIKNLISL